MSKYVCKTCGEISNFHMGTEPCHSIRALCVECTRRFKELPMLTENNKSVVMSNHELVVDECRDSSVG